jgi:hypothetical protein
MAQPKPTRVIVGVDTHGDIHVACAIDELGRHLATAGFPTTPSLGPQHACALGQS